MAAPNLKNPSTVLGKSALYSCTTSLAAALGNAASSNKLFKVNTVRAANTTNNSVNIDLSFYRSASHTYFAKNATIPPNSSLVLTDKNEYIYLEEDDALYAKASVGTAIDLTIHYEEIS